MLVPRASKKFSGGKCRAQRRSGMVLFSIELRLAVQELAASSRQAIYYTKALRPAPHIAPPHRVYDEQLVSPHFVSFKPRSNTFSMLTPGVPPLRCLSYAPARCSLRHLNHNPHPDARPLVKLQLPARPSATPTGQV